MKVGGITPSYLFQSAKYMVCSKSKAPTDWCRSLPLANLWQLTLCGGGRKLVLVKFAPNSLLPPCQVLLVNFAPNSLQTSLDKPSRAKPGSRPHPPWPGRLNHSHARTTRTPRESKAEHRGRTAIIRKVTPILNRRRGLVAPSKVRTPLPLALSCGLGAHANPQSHTA